MTKQATATAQPRKSNRSRRPMCSECKTYSGLNTPQGYAAAPARIRAAWDNAQAWSAANEAEAAAERASWIAQDKRKAITEAAEQQEIAHKQAQEQRSAINAAEREAWNTARAARQTVRKAYNTRSFADAAAAKAEAKAAALHVENLHNYITATA